MMSMLPAGISAHFTSDEVETLVRTAGDVVSGHTRDDLSTRQCELAELAYLLATIWATTDGPEPDVAKLARTTAELAAAVNDLEAAWDTAADTDTNLGVAVEGAGRSLCDLLGDICWCAPAGHPIRLELSSALAELEPAVDHYTDLDEHDLDASIAIFDQLGPTVALAQRTIDLLTPLRTGEQHTSGRVTVGQLIERLRQFPPDLEVWTTDRCGSDGFVRLNGGVVLGADPEPASGDPVSFVVLVASQ